METPEERTNAFRRLQEIIGHSSPPTEWAGRKKAQAGATKDDG